MQKLFILAALFASLSSCGQTTPANKSAAQELNCEPDAPVECSFLNMPSSVNSVLNITVDAGIPKMKISGKVYKADGVTPYANVLMYVFHTDETGKYSKNGSEKGVQKWHGRHHGWVKTDGGGNYTINSIRPAQYPGNTIVAHIHATIKEPGRKPYWINDFVFKDDPLVTDSYKSSLQNADGDGIVDVKLIDGVWVGTRDIVLKNQ